MKTISWKLKNEKQATVTISVDKGTRTFRDDFMGEIKKDAPASTWTIKYDAHVEGHGDVNGLRQPLEKTNLPEGVAGKIGKLGFNAEILEKIETAISEVKASHEWTEHLAAAAAAEKNEREYYASRRKIEKAMEE